MARKPKIDTGKLTNGQRAESTARTATSSAAEEPKSTGAKPKKSASRKKSVRTNMPTSGAMATSGYEPTDEEIAVRAYFIAERRLQLALEGDSDQDWLEAKRQLVEEAKRSSS